MKRIGNRMRCAPWDLVKLVCFSDPDIDGNHFSEADYVMLYRLAPNTRNALRS
jgi:hypothetical protein